MAERLGTGLQNLLQRFDSAWHLQSPLAQGGLFFYWIVIHIYKEDDAMAAIGRYMTEIGAGYTPGEYCIPYCLIAGTEETRTSAGPRSASSN